YTPASWIVLTDAIAATQAVETNANATQAEVDQAVEALQAAIGSLELLEYNYEINEVKVSVSGLSATVSVGVKEYHELAEHATVVFQLMDGNTPVQLVAVKNDIQDGQVVQAQFNLPASKSYTVKAFLWDTLSGQQVKAAAQTATITP
ncbi:MAG: hypothetical protein ACYDG6_02775, partial [Thermincolia bacterium]